MVLDCKVAANKFGTYCVPASSANRPAAKAVLRGEVYEPDTIAFMSENCGDQDVVHAGTYFGDFLPALSSAVGDSALIWAFEPNYESHRCAEITVRINQIENVRLRNAGLGAESSTSYIQTTSPRGRALGGMSRIVSGEVAGTRTEAVTIVAVDEVVPESRSVGVLQLDVEGYEYQALSGALRTLRRCKPILVLEQQPNDAFLDSVWFEENVLALGYEFAHKLHLNRVYRPV